MANTAYPRATHDDHTLDELEIHGVHLENDTENSSGDDSEEGVHSDTINIPADVWSEIFQHFLSDYSEYPTNPLIFTQVCRSWRNIALRTPRLWETLRIEWRFPTEKKKTIDPVLRAQKIKGGVDSWLQRSGALPLTVSLNIRHSDGGHWAWNKALLGCLIDTIGLVSQRSKRLKSLSVSGRDLIPLVRRPFNLLTDTRTTASLPNLIDFSFTLVYTSVQTLPSTILRALARQCPSLKTCNLYFERGRSFDELLPSSSPITWSSLTHLILSFDYALTNATRAVLQDTFDSIRAPNLTSLDLSITPANSRDLINVQFIAARPNERLEAPFHQFLLESKCRLTSLGLHMPFGPPVLQTLDELLAPSLKHLSVTGFHPNQYHGTHTSAEDAYTPDVNTARMLGVHLIPDANASSIKLPHLEDLEVTCPRRVHSTETALELKSLGYHRVWKRFRVLYTEVTKEELEALERVKSSTTFMDDTGLREGVIWEYDLKDGQYLL